MIFRRFACVALFGLISGTALPAAPADTPAPAAPTPVAYCLIIDNTPAMRSQLVSFITLGQTFVENNTPADETAIITFSNRDNTTLEQRFTTKQALLLHSLDNMYAQGGAPDLLDAVYLAADMLAENAGVGKPVPANHALVLLTAGANADSFYRTEQVLAMLREKHVRVYVIGFPQVLGPDAKVEAAARELCRQLAAESGGRAFFPANHDEAKESAREIIGLIRMQAAGSAK
jgi:hypothetical protein